MTKTGKVVIRKYANRRLYDTSGSRYVNLEDIAALIRNGTDVQVIDGKTGQDLTRVTLTQIILEDARHEPAGVPLELLRQLIVTSDTVRREFVKSAVDAYSKLQDAVQSGISGVRDAALSPLEAVSGFMQANRGESRDVQELRERLAELETRVNKPKRPRRRVKR
ncbi:MAG TPA: polyhydroxyalkanoate synthesis regulator DNA-binding domain-containing protein [Terriglobales bacterium]|jgi:polyhydroxyalkanoate synthesis repressor PhaR|nr:polyhydroxyalkanoate synthesis regulator DNA-binding domain-containing protein [Terriglobales bacterium]